ncbi:hypothetical protein V5E97_02915 [Singulisphaera sp. Ch08]|uniref:Uncharacterized protein n=1 Tax=Singulisphaera sp. Ch08 TaxID=3120278 RepID=A0AAU7CIZ9_9BACT
MSAASLFGRVRGAVPRVVHNPAVRKKGSEFADEFFTEMCYDLQAEQMGIPTQTGQPTVGGTAYQAVKGLMVSPMMSGSAKSVVLPRTHADEQRRERYKKAVTQVVPGNAVVLTHLSNDQAFMEAFKVHRSPGGGTPALSTFIDGKLELMDIQTPEEAERE